jgi:hypothetical protein
MTKSKLTLVGASVAVAVGLFSAKVLIAPPISEAAVTASIPVEQLTLNAPRNDEPGLAPGFCLSSDTWTAARVATIERTASRDPLRGSVHDLLGGFGRPFLSGVSQAPFQGLWEASGRGFEPPRQTFALAGVYAVSRYV